MRHARPRGSHPTPTKWLRLLLGVGVLAGVFTAAVAIVALVAVYMT